jgi:hypothetical protein
MAQASHAELDKHLQRVVGTAGYTNSGSTVTISSVNVDAARMAELFRVAAVTRHTLSLVAGAVTLVPA